MKTIAVFTLLFFAIPAYCDDPTLCAKTLRACEDLSNAQEDEIVILKRQVSTLEERLEDSQTSSNVPVWVWIVIGVGAGAFISSTVSH